MKEIIRVEAKRVLSNRLLFILLSAVLSYSIVSCYINYIKYNVYDSSGNMRISAADNLSDYIKRGEQLLDPEKLQEVINRRDGGGYISYLNPVKIILVNYSDKKIKDISTGDILSFYTRRLENMRSDFQQMRIFTDQQINYLLLQASQLKTPLKTGYAEGWRNLNNDLIDFVPIILIVISIILLSVFGKNPKFDMQPLCLSTAYGKATLIRAKIMTGLAIGSGFYFLSILLFTLPRIIMFGLNGYNLPIQSDFLYFYSTYNITHLQQYLLNVAIGFVAVLLMASIVLFLTSIVEQILSGAVLVVFCWVMMLALPNTRLSDLSLIHYTACFLPYTMTDFSSYYQLNDLYGVFHEVIPSVCWIIPAGLTISAALLLITLGIHIMKINKKWRFRCVSS